MRQKPLICFAGDKKRCYGVMRNLNSSVKSIYLDRNISNSNKLKYNFPWLFCIVPEKDITDYSEVIGLSRKTRCPVYAICTPLQLKALRKHCKEFDIQQITVPQLRKKAREITCTIKECGSQLEAFKSRMETISIISSNPALAAYSAEHSIPVGSDNRAVITSADFDECSEMLDHSEKSDGYIITDNADETAPAQIRKIATIIPDDKTPAFYVGNDEKKRTPKNFKYVSIRSEKDIIGKALKKHSKNK